MTQTWNPTVPGEFHAALLAVVHAAEQAFHASTSRPPASDAAAQPVFDALHDGRLVSERLAVHPGRLPVCEFVEAAGRPARDRGGPIGDLAHSIDAISGRVAWQRRPDADLESPEFAAGHADTVLLRSDEAEPVALVGISVLAPGVRYPDHHHLAEEVYIVVSPGEWRTNHEEWHEPGVGGVVHTPSDAVHAMRAVDSPLLAVWLHTRPGAPS